MNNDIHLIWEAKQRQAVLLENSELVWQALFEAQQIIEETKVTPAMVDQINQQIGTKLTLDQLNQIQTITNPGLASRAGSALGRLGGAIKDFGGKAFDAAKQQVTDPNSGLRQGLQKAGELGQAGLAKGAQLAQQGAGAVATGVQKGANAVAAGADAVGNAAGDFADGVKDGYGSTQEDPNAPGIKRGPGGRFVKGNQSGVQYAEDLEGIYNESILNRPGWANQRIN
jgi:hypothetical protein